MMQFYMTPGSCTTGIHILLEEVGEIFQVNLVNLMAGDNKKPEYLALNPKGTIPTLKVDDSLVLTDFLAIAWWLGRQFPKRKLLPESFADEIKVLEVMNYAVNHIHGSCFARVFTPEKYCLRQQDQSTVIEQGKLGVTESFAIVEHWLHDRSFVVDHFTIADAALFYVEFWADRTGIILPPRCKSHFQRILQRPSVQQVMIEEGYGSILKTA
jgi:glutathione S-transferase